LFSISGGMVLAAVSSIGSVSGPQWLILGPWTRGDRSLTYAGDVDFGAEAGSFVQREAPCFFGCVPPYRPLTSRADVLVFESALLAARFEIAGPLEVHRFIATDAPGTDFTA
jgi:uncharacterized protein